MQIQNLTVSYPVHGGFFGGVTGHIKAVNDVSFEIAAGETLGLVGESGCGKSTLGKSIVQLIKPAKGQVLFDGSPTNTASSTDLKTYRRNVQMIFQDPYSSLNPRMRIGSILEEPLIVHSLCKPQMRKKRVVELLQVVGLRPESFDKYPHEFSGGQRQRIGIARALAVEPRFIVADEPVSALDVSIQAQILNLLRKLQRDYRLTYLFISHDLNVVRYLCDRIVVMYLGRVMEVLTRAQLADPSFPKHPYTEALLTAAPRKHPLDKKERAPLKGDIPSPARPPTGCVFHTRCPEVIEPCRLKIPELTERGQHLVACHQRKT